MVIIVRCNDVDPDPRVQKYVEYLKKNNLLYKIVAWDRSGKGLTDSEHIVYYKRPCGFGAGMRNFFSKIFWMIFVARTLIKHQKCFQTVHACDFDAAFPALIMKIFNKTVIFDVFDWIEASKSSPILIRIIASLEKICIKMSDHIIVCEEYRIRQIGVHHRSLLVMPNIPELDIWSGEKLIESDKLILSYVGVFDDNRGLNDLMNIVSRNQNYLLKIAGFGKFEKLVQDYSERYDNIQYYGKVQYAEGLNLMYNSDLIAAFYYVNNCPVHLYAAPNKYYESTMLGKPIVSNQGTYMANRIIENDVGIITSEDINDIKEKLECCFRNKASLIQKGRNGRALWERLYRNQIDNFLNAIYKELL